MASSEDAAPPRKDCPGERVKPHARRTEVLEIIKNQDAERIPVSVSQYTQSHHGTQRRRDFG